MDKLVIASSVIVVLFHIFFFFVIQYGLGWQGKKDKRKSHNLFKKVAFGTIGQFKAKSLLSSTK